jgi:hypothetical protein
MSLYFQDEHINTWPAEATAKTTNIGPTDILITFGSPTCNMAGLPKTSVLKGHWLAVVKRIHVIGKYGEADDELRRQVNKNLPERPAT